MDLGLRTFSAVLDADPSSVRVALNYARGGDTGRSAASGGGPWARGRDGAQADLLRRGRGVAGRGRGAGPAGGCLRARRRDARLLGVRGCGSAPHPPLGPSGRIDYARCPCGQGQGHRRAQYWQPEAVAVVARCGRRLGRLLRGPRDRVRGGIRPPRRRQPRRPLAHNMASGYQRRRGEACLGEAKRAGAARRRAVRRAVERRLPRCAERSPPAVPLRARLVLHDVLQRRVTGGADEALRRGRRTAGGGEARRAERRRTRGRSRRAALHGGTDGRLGPPLGAAKPPGVSAHGGALARWRGGGLRGVGAARPRRMVRRGVVLVGVAGGGVACQDRCLRVGRRRPGAIASGLGLGVALMALP
mmetsp:Transcript_33989/g.97921  ORF Transcript_33989/g.97921 Transcript_33989/m.97921 type:complete len:360 (-) Transcript_33989:69-1148(-)